ncbi:MAG: septal ring lytic transglycosylase RlpA family protein [Flavobacterium sp.]|nr:septal ring lytic transglycosylase RlpA family protein [Flavobacterium sp.]
MTVTKKIVSIILLIVVFSVSFSFTRLPKMFFQQPKVVSKDTIKKNAEIADSLNLVSNLKLKLFKKNAHASYYADKFTGRRTASGRKFDNSKYTAAHRKLPFGTKLKVTNEANGRSVIVEITDRGPFTKGRDIDLTKKAFMQIASSRYGGSLKVTIEEIK